MIVPQMIPVKLCPLNIQWLRLHQRFHFHGQKACQKVPQVGYIGWDVAITEKGACLVEGNEFPGVFQIKPSYMDKPEGILPRYNKYMK